MSKRETNKPELIFIGSEGGEEYYLNLGDDNVRGWSFMGLRPETEEALRERARDTRPQDILGISTNDFNAIERYFDYERFEDDMEEDWENSHDIQAERMGQGDDELHDVTYYLGFGSATSIFDYFEQNKITGYDSYLQHFDDAGLMETEFEGLMALVKKGQERQRGMVSTDNKEEHAKDEAEKKEFVDYFLNIKK